MACARMRTDGWMWTDLSPPRVAHGYVLTKRFFDRSSTRATSSASRSATTILIRANQGHSTAIDLDLPAREPAESLYHGTASRFLPSIMAIGLDRGDRHHVHLTESLETARSVGSRYGVPVILRIDAIAMSAAGHVFRCSANRVWLVDAVPSAYLEVFSPG